MADEVFEQGRSQRLDHVEARQIKWRIKRDQTKLLYFSDSELQRR